WKEVLNFRTMAEWGAIAENDQELLTHCDTPQDAFERLRSHLVEHHLEPATEQEAAAPGIAKKRGRHQRRRGAQKTHRPIQGRLPRGGRGARGCDRRGARCASGAGEMVGSRNRASPRRQRNGGGVPAEDAARRRPRADRWIRPGRVREGAVLRSTDRGVT